MATNKAPDALIAGTTPVTSGCPQQTVAEVERAVAERVLAEARMLPTAKRGAGKQMEGGGAMTVVMVIWLVVLSVSLYVVYRRVEEGRGLQWRLDELRREVESTKRNLDETRKKLERATFPV